ncbi:MAG: hypothetical protein ACE5M4_13115, partial [Anaerolineales bacterium]
SRRDKVCGIERPGHSDKGVVLRYPRPFSGEPTVGAIGVASLRVILEQIDAVAIAAVDLARLQAELDSGRHADADVVRADLEVLGLEMRWNVDFGQASTS